MPTIDEELKQKMKEILKEKVPSAETIELKVKKISRKQVIFVLRWMDKDGKKLLSREIEPIGEGSTATIYYPSHPIEWKFL